MTLKGLNKIKIVKKRSLKVRRFQSDRVQKVKVEWNSDVVAKLAQAQGY